MSKKISMHLIIPRNAGHIILTSCVQMQSILAWMEFDHLGEMSPDKDCFWWLMVQHPEPK